MATVKIFKALFNSKNEQMKRETGIQDKLFLIEKHLLFLECRFFNSFHFLRGEVSFNNFCMRQFARSKNEMLFLRCLKTRQLEEVFSVFEVIL